MSGIDFQAEALRAATDWLKHPLFLQAIEDVCREQLGQALKVYSRDVSLAEARQINGLRAVFGEVGVLDARSAAPALL